MASSIIKSNADFFISNKLGIGRDLKGTKLIKCNEKWIFWITLNSTSWNAVSSTHIYKYFWIDCTIRQLHHGRNAPIYSLNVHRTTAQFDGHGYWRWLRTFFFGWFASIFRLRPIPFTQCSFVLAFKKATEQFTPSVKCKCAQSAEIFVQHHIHKPTSWSFCFWILFSLFWWVLFFISKFSFCHVSGTWSIRWTAHYSP